jgi:hypothetical protein
MAHRPVNPGELIWRHAAAARFFLNSNGPKTYTLKIYLSPEYSLYQWEAWDDDSYLREEATGYPYREVNFFLPVSVSILGSGYLFGSPAVLSTSGTHRLDLDALNRLHLHSVLLLRSAYYQFGKANNKVGPVMKKICYCGTGCNRTLDWCTDGVLRSDRPSCTTCASRPRQITKEVPSRPVLVHLRGKAFRWDPERYHCVDCMAFESPDRRIDDAFKCYSIPVHSRYPTKFRATARAILAAASTRRAADLVNLRIWWYDD